MPATDPGQSVGPTLVTDFDGTLTRHDFYRLVIERLLPPGTPDYWGEYRAGWLTHFEALRAIFAAAPAGEAVLAELAGQMEIEPGLAGEVAALQDKGWRVVVASAGCDWYIRRLLAEGGVAVEVHANPGRIEGGRLIMRLPTESPYFSATTGIDKEAVVRAALAGGGPVAFAGDGPPDLAPARLVPARLRFARAHLADELGRLGEDFRPFDRWADVARALRAEGVRPC
jgi:2-hydroxy-3-keto-5-methylthiopentenyl-1-phosphate phosphatase